MTKRLLQVSHADLEKALREPAANRCEALRQHYAVLVATRAVFARCDTGDQRAEHAAQLTASIEQFRKGMPADCGPR